MTHQGQDDWTRVRYRRGRMRQRDRSPPPRVGSGSFSRRYHEPRQPTRTYAAAARAPPPPRTYRREDRRGPPVQQRRGPPPVRSRADFSRRSNRYEGLNRANRGQRGTGDPPPSDPDFTLRTRVVYRLIKAKHHLSNVTAPAPPTSITRTAQNLAAVIKPAAPNATTLSLIDGNAKNWAYTTLLILRDHYRDCIQNDLQILVQLEATDWRENFEVASAWARRHFGRRLHQDTLDDTQVLLIQHLSRAPPTHTPTAAHTVVDPTLAVASLTQSDNPQPPTHTQTQTALPLGPVGTQPVTTQTPLQRAAPPAAPPSTPAAPEPAASPAAPLAAAQPPHRPPAAQRKPAPARQLSVTAEIHAQPTGNLLLRDVPAPPTPRLLSRSTMTEQKTDWSPEPQSPPFLLPPLPPSFLSSPLPLVSAPILSPSLSSSSGLVPDTLPDPLEQRPRRTTRSQTAAPSSPQPPASQPTEGPAPPEDTSNTATADEVIVLDASPQVAPLPSAPRTALGPVQRQLSFGPPAAAAATTTDAPVRRPTRHINTTRKMKEWCLSARSKWLIIGDSNVARFPPFQCPDLQIDSFPGATFRHAEAILARTNVSANIEKLILSFGVNNRAQKTMTTVKQVQRAIRMAKLAFPQATVMVPEINFSRHLPHAEQENLRQLNHYITNNQLFLPALSRNDFTTERDGIHWTHSTAQHMLDHWLESLK